MFKRTLFAGLLALASSAPALAHGGYYDNWVDARVIRVEPVVSFSYSNRGGNDAFRILYEWGGNHYWTYGHRHPGRVIRVRPPRVVHHYYPPYYRHEHRHEYRHDWRNDDRHYWHRGRGRDDGGRHW